MARGGSGKVTDDLLDHILHLRGHHAKQASRMGAAHIAVEWDAVYVADLAEAFIAAAALADRRAILVEMRTVVDMMKASQPGLE